MAGSECLGIVRLESKQVKRTSRGDKKGSLRHESQTVLEAGREHLSGMWSNVASAYYRLNNLNNLRRLGMECCGRVLA